jgi:hypothetical protein
MAAGGGTSRSVPDRAAHRLEHRGGVEPSLYRRPGEFQKELPKGCSTEQDSRGDSAGMEIPQARGPLRGDNAGMGQVCAGQSNLGRSP